MEDRFKFRVWVKSMKKYFYNVSWNIDIGLNDSTTTVLLNVGRTFPEITTLSDIVIEQCTGLKDKKRSNIYEGDVLKSPYASCDGVYRPIKVKWDKAGFKFVFNEKYDQCLIADGIKKTEIMGNIHENPELVENDYVRI